MSPTKLRSLYRRLLRELPSPGTTTVAQRLPSNSKPSVLSHPTPTKHLIRSSIASSTPPPSRQQQSTQKDKPVEHHIQVTEQFVQYLKAQRTYATLVERYNPGMNMNDVERVRLSARRIGMNLPKEFETGEGDGGKS
jgi:ATP synthase assembly factor FMC1, mitochondrial